MGESLKQASAGNGVSEKSARDRKLSPAKSQRLVELCWEQRCCSWVQGRRHDCALGLHPNSNTGNSNDVGMDVSLEKSVHAQQTMKSRHRKKLELIV